MKRFKHYCLFPFQTISTETISHRRLKLAKRYTRPIEFENIHFVREEFIGAQLKLQARRKLTRILQLKATFEQHINVRDMVKIYCQGSMGKRGTWSAPKKVLTIDHNERSVLVLKKAGKRCNVAIENVGLAIREESFGSALQSAMD